MWTIRRRLAAVTEQGRSNQLHRWAVALFIVAQIGVPLAATIHRWLTGRDSWWGWQMFSS